MTKDELKHSIDHALSSLDVEPWEDFKQDIEHVKQKIDDAKKQLEFVRDVLIDSVISR